MKLFNIFKKKKNGISNIKKYNQQTQEVIALALKYKKLEDSALAAKTEEFKTRISNGETLNDILVEAFAVVYSTSQRILKLKPHPVQIYGAIVLHNGDVAEMKTGEGKTLTSTMVAYLNALSQNGVHIITVNDYLAERDSREMGELFLWLGLSVGFNNSTLSKTQKKLAYEQDITYSTHSELGFDYLRDNMVDKLKDKVQRGLNFAIIDECDSILIDDARTPLIISGGEKDQTKLYQVANQFVKMLDKDKDYEIDVETETISLTSDGSKKAELAFKLDNLFDVQHTILIHHIQQALKANFVLTKDIEYVVSSNRRIELIDANTGRILKGRAYSDGLHQALEQKEGLEISAQSKTIATITYQNLFRLYNKLAGMTGTAATEAEEFLDIYNMKVEIVKTNKPIVRVDENDSIFGTQEASFNAIIENTTLLHKKGQPVLIGTRSVEASQLLSNALKKAKLKHVVLNAKQHTKEGAIIEAAGQKGAITIATNMAGRGTDIKLGKGVKQIGGLAVLGCERNESRRIDNQLIGRSGRQGDPGYTKFYISWEDELLVRFAGDKAKKQAQLLRGESVESGLITKVIESAQKRIEGQNYDSRKTLVEFDDVIRRQRETIYKQRDQIIVSENILPVLEIMFKHVAKTFSEKSIVYIDKEKHIDGIKICQDIDQLKLIDSSKLDAIHISTLKYNDALKHIQKLFLDILDKKQEELGKKLFTKAKKQVVLNILDQNWQDHIDTMTKLRSGIHLRSYSQKSPLQSYVKEGYDIFESMKENISLQIVYTISSLEIDEK